MKSMRSASSDLIICFDFATPAGRSRALNRFTVNSLVTLAQIVRQMTDQATILIPFVIDPVQQGIDPGQIPAGAGLGLGDNPEYPGIPDQLADGRHATEYLLVDTNICLWLRHILGFLQEKPLAD
jgi:hypothetical protein